MDRLQRRESAAAPDLSPRLDHDTLQLVASGLLRALAGEAVRRVLVTSCNAREGKTFVALHMALALSGKGLGEVLLLDANPENPELAAQPGRGRQGLLDALAGAQPDASPVDGVPNLSVMTYGGGSRDDAELMRAGNRLAEVLTMLRHRYDWLIADGPPVFAPFEAPLIAPAFDGVMLVVRTGRTRREVMQTAHRRLLASGAKVIGVVMNRRRYYVPRALY